jgi:hypothetical protein
VLATQRFALAVPWAHIGRVALATIAMAESLVAVSWSTTKLGLFLEVVVGCLVYAVTIAILYWRDIRDLLTVRLVRPAGGTVS